MLNPFGLNCLAQGKEPSLEEYNIYAMTWCHPDPCRINIGYENIKSAWENDSGKVELPVAISPTYVHQRIPAQRSCFTIHGKRKESICELLSGKDILKKYVIEQRNSIKMLEELRTLGVSWGSLFPDIDGLARDLTELFRPDLTWPEIF